jgi:hypothetical protein
MARTAGSNRAGVGGRFKAKNFEQADLSECDCERTAPRML